MPNKLTTVLLGFFFFAAFFGPRLVLAESMPARHSCHEAPAEMPAACAVHCFSKAVTETEVEIIPVSSVEFVFPEIIDYVLSERIFENCICQFFEDRVFRDPLVILTTIKRE